jgi:mannitol 2-dehydrogenase
VRERFGVEDQWPVVCEPFTQWVLEDDFAAGRPPYEDAGVQLVDDVEPYELMKLRLLNASHQALCYFGYLSGYRLVHDAAQDPLFAFLLGYMDEEATPTLKPVPGHRPARVQADADRALRQPRRCATPSRGCASRARTASRSGCSR